MKRIVFSVGPALLVSALHLACGGVGETVDEEVLQSDEAIQQSDEVIVQSGAADQQTGAVAASPEAALSLNGSTPSPTVQTSASVFSYLGGDMWDRDDANWCDGYKERLYMGDFNGDGRRDMCCHNEDTGYLRFSYADNYGKFIGDNWERDAHFCYDKEDRIYFGDYDDDGRDDMLCHNRKMGNIYIDYASSIGRFMGIDWQRSGNFCKKSTERLYIGDFNNDKRRDLLCHASDTGYLVFDYASPSGRFMGSDWERNEAFCNHGTDRIYVGDFNDDGRRDLLCHDSATGRMSIQYARAHGRFVGIDWERDEPWCNHSNDELWIGDFNYDRHDDLFCRDRSTGFALLDYANFDGRFYGTNREYNVGWCKEPTSRIYLGDFDGNHESDILCHDTSLGSLHLMFSRF